MRLSVLPAFLLDRRGCSRSRAERFSAAAGRGAARRRNKKYVSATTAASTRPSYCGGAITAIEYITGVSYNLAERH